jgi:hypothetical protein
MANTNVYFDIDQTRFVYPTTGVPLAVKDYPVIVFKEQKIITWNIGYWDSTTSTFIAQDLTDYAVVSWQSSIDYDFVSSTDPMIRVLDVNIDDSDAADGIIVVTYDADTTDFENAVDGQTNGRRLVELQLKGNNGAGKLACDFTPMDKQLYARQQVDPGSDPVGTTVGNYYTKTEIDGKFYYNKSVDFSLANAAVLTIVLFDKTEVTSGSLDITFSDTVNRNRIIARVLYSIDGSIIPDTSWIYDNAKQITITYTYDVSGDNVRINITNSSGNTITGSYQLFDYTNTRLAQQNLSWKGAWSALTTYGIGECVSISGCSYISLDNGNLNHEPPNASYWGVLALSGEAGGVEAHAALTTGVHGVGAGTIAKTSDITATKLDDFATPDNNTDLNANTTNHGLLLQATAPVAGLYNYVGITNGETAYTNKALFDATDPSTQALGDAAAAGSAAVAARRDHKHAMPSAAITNIGNGSAQYQLPVTGATPFTPVYTTATGTGSPVLATAPTFVTNISTPIIKPSSDSTTAVQITKANGSTGIVIIDTSNNRIGLGITPTKTFHSAVGSISNAMLVETYSSAGEYSYLSLKNSHNNTVGTKTQSATNDILGSFLFEGVNNASAYNYGASISAQCTGTPGTYIPTKITFTTFSSSASNTGALIMNSNGNVSIGNSDDTARLKLPVGAAAASKAPLKFTQASAILLSSPEAGAVEVNDGDVVYYTIKTGTARKEFVLADATLTSGRVPFCTTLGRLTDDADLTFSGDTLSATKVATSTVKTDTSTPTDLSIITGAAKTLALDTPVYDDANVGALTLRTGGTAPGIVQIVDNDGDNTGLYTAGFDVNEEGSGVIEVPHSYKEGTDLIFHIHWGANDAPAGGTDNVKWQLTYSVSRAGATFPDSTAATAVEVAYTTRYNWLITNVATITGATGGVDGGNIKIGDQVHFKIKRIAASSDEFGGEALMATIGFHYQIDTIGSRAITTK